MSHVEQLSRTQQLRSLYLIAAQLRYAPLYGIGVCRVLMLDDGHRHAVDHEHHVGAVALAGWRSEPPLPGHMQNVGRRVVEVYEPDLPVSLLGLVVPLPLAPQPGQHLAVALDGRRERLEVLKHRADGVVRQPGVEPAERALDLASKQQPGLAASQDQGILRRHGRPPDLRRVADHRELDRACFGYVDFSHGRFLLF